MSCLLLFKSSDCYIYHNQNNFSLQASVKGFLGVAETPAGVSESVFNYQKHQIWSDWFVLYVRDAVTAG